MLEDVCQVGAAPQAFEKAATLADAAPVLDHARQPAHQALVEAADFVGGGIFQITQFDPRLEHGKAGPNVWAAKDHHLLNFHNQSVIPKTRWGARAPGSGAASKTPGKKRLRARRSADARPSATTSAKYIWSNMKSIGARNLLAFGSL